jgi:hypothetical protein
MEGKEGKHKHRLKGLFSREKKVATNEDHEDDVDDFLRGSSDKLNFPAPTPTPSSPPRLSKLDTSTARRWPSATEIHNSKVVRGRSASPKRNRKGLVVRFTDERPEIIGEGGEEAELPTAEVALRIRANTHPSRGQRSTDYAGPHSYNTLLGDGLGGADHFRPGPLKRTQTGYESISESKSGLPEAGDAESAPAHHVNSFAARVKAEMQSGEGKALVEAAHTTDQQSSLGEVSGGDMKSQLDEVQRNTLNNVHIPPPPKFPPQLVPGRPSTPTSTQQQGFGTENGPVSNSRSSTSNTLVESPIPLSRLSTTNSMVESPERLSRSSTLTLHGATLALSDDSLQEFSKRVAHLFTLFRLSAESILPLSKCSLQQIMRAASWWFLHGRLNLEATVRERTSSPQAEKANFATRQQAYANLAKSMWLIETAVPQYHEQSSSQTTSNSSTNELREIKEAIMSSLRKLAMSMKRNNFLPPEEAPLPQGLDSSIWIQEDGNESLLASQKQTVSMSISYSMPIGDSTQCFQYARLFANGTLIENGEQHQYRCAVLVSLVRSRSEKTLSLIVSNQSGMLNIMIQADKSRGPTWEDIEWHTQTSVIAVRLPRGFTLQMHCSQHDFRTFWGMYDYQRKLYADFKPQNDEILIFESTLRAFQYFDQDGNTTFPKEPIPNCQLRAFQKIAVEKAATGAKNTHRGFRIGLVTSSSTKVLRGINQELPSDLPIKFGFLRGEAGLPAFLIKISNGKVRYTMVYTFNDAKDRAMLHSRLTGVSLRGVETVVAEAQMKSLHIAQPKADSKESDCLKGLEWQAVKVINEDQGDMLSSKNVLSESLRVVMECRTGCITDRFNVGPGDLKLRLDVTAPAVLKVLRQPQQDLTVSVLESQVSKEILGELAQLLGVIAKAETVRTYTFPAQKDLHLFQAALTGFSVIFDGMATSFNISRRRMVVPIYKKWDAVTTRVQVVERDHVVQLVAFFENFSHGDCIQFPLKSTDVFESSAKSGKYSLRIVDAKFALPKAQGDGEVAVDKGFICLDMPEYPGEHDDITIVFDNEAGILHSISTSYKPRL